MEKTPMKHADKLDLLRSYALNEWPGPALILRTNSKGTVLHMEEISLQIWNWSRGMATTTTKLLQDKKGFFFFFLHGYEITFDGHADN